MTSAQICFDGKRARLSGCGIREGQAVEARDGSPGL